MDGRDDGARIASKVGFSLCEGNLNNAGVVDGKVELESNLDGEAA